jgi:Na+/proline symporter
MLLSLFVSIWLLGEALDPAHGKTLAQEVAGSGYARMFDFDDILGGNHFVKNFLGGMFIAIGMTGLDQDMMQKNLSCRNIREAQWNMMTFTGVLVFVNFCFLVLGALLYMYADAAGVQVPVLHGRARTDLLFAEVALNQGLGFAVGILFLLGLIAAAYSSADSALAALTTSVCVDFLGIDKMEKSQQERTRKRAHIGMSAVTFAVILVLSYTMTDNAIGALIYYAGFTYGPLIGLFFFGLLTKRSLPDKLVPVVCVAAPLLAAFLQSPWHGWFGDYQFGPELILVNALITYGGLWLISRKG